MLCIKCHQNKTQVVNSRPHKKHASVWRRRHCTKCGSTFTTTETVTGEQLKVVSYSGVPTSYSQPRLLVSLYDSLKHRPEAADDAFWLSTTVSEQLGLNAQGGLLNVDELTRRAYQALKHFDAAAGMHYGLQHGLITTSRRRT